MSVNFAPDLKQTLSVTEKDVMHSLDKLNTELDIVALENLLCHTIPEATGDRFSCFQFRGLSMRHNESELAQAADWLLSFLDDKSSQNLSPHVLSDVHSFIGLIRERNGEYESSHAAYVSAAWIAQRTEKEQLAVSLYRLGTLYGKKGCPQQMVATMKKACAVYNKDGARARRAKAA